MNVRFAHAALQADLLDDLTDLTRTTAAQVRLDFGYDDMVGRD